jgi:hypothetical protein
MREANSHKNRISREDEFTHHFVHKHCNSNFIFFLRNCRRQARLRRALKIFENTRTSLLISRPKWDPPPLHAGECVTPRWESKLACGRGSGGSQFQRGIVLILFCYAVPRIKIFSLVRYCPKKAYRFREIP